MDPTVVQTDIIADPNDTTIQEHYASIIEYKKNEMKVNYILSLPETEEEEKEQLLELKEGIETALQAEQTTLKDKQKKHNLFSLSQELLTVSDEKKLTKCFMKEERKWKNAEVITVDVEEQTAEIKIFGNPENQTFPAYYLKVLKQPNPQLFKEGTYCKAIFSQDGEFYPCVVQKVDEEGYHVKYKKYGNKEIVKLSRLRPMQNPNEKKEEIKFQDLNEFKVPEKLKILPNDPENVKKSKKTKLKALKFAFKNAQVQEVNKEKKDKWKTFNSNAAPSKAGHFKTRYDMDVLNKKAMEKR